MPLVPLVPRVPRLPRPSRLAPGRRRRLPRRGRAGQGTVEYLGLVLVVGVLLVAVSQHVDGAAGVGKTISRSFANAVDRVTATASRR